jgi:hypothetical protein
MPQIRGRYSDRPFDPSRAGGPVEHLMVEETFITAQGILLAERHLSRFEPDDENLEMLRRLRRIAQGSMQPTSFDLNFYCHELREFQRYQALGWPEGQPDDLEDAYNLWNNAHTATLEDFRVTDDDLYHPDVRSPR